MFKMQMVFAFLSAILPLRLGFAQEGSSSKEYVLGWVTPDSLCRACPEFQPTPGAYQPSERALQLLRCYDEPATVLIFFGSWCGDSKREVPRFYAALDRAANKNFTARLFGLDRSKKDAAGFAEAFGITHVPTFIFLNGNRVFSSNSQAFIEQTTGELGRITETPATSLEQDWTDILKHNEAWARKMEWERRLYLWLLSITLFAIH
ncbi:MAG: TlpA family protein disulfide reductase [bacterium]